MRSRIGSLLSVVMVVIALALAAAPRPAAAQNPDLYSYVTGTVTLGPAPAIAGNTARTGSWVNRTGFQSVAVLITAGHVVEATTARRYAVLQDSAAGAALATVDSVQLDTVDNVVSKLRYTGLKAFVRILIRAGTGAGDSAYTAATVLLGNQRRRT